MGPKINLKCTLEDNLPSETFVDSLRITTGHRQAHFKIGARGETRTLMLSAMASKTIVYTIPPLAQNLAGTAGFEPAT